VSCRGDCGRIQLTYSRLYSEKAYVLSRSFVRTALERPPTGLEDELRYFYLTKGRLGAVIEHARRLIQKGEEEGGKMDSEEENEEMWDGDAMGSLTMGAILTLKVSYGDHESCCAKLMTADDNGIGEDSGGADSGVKYLEFTPR
jgi:hypothetical protein